MFYLDPLYMLFGGAGLLLALVASGITKSTFKKYSRVGSRQGWTGAQAAANLLHAAGLDSIRIEQVGGFLSDHYDPLKRVLRLSPDVYGSQSLSAIGVACHEAGHAIQHARGYVPLHLRTLMVPAVSIGSNLSYFVLMLGMLLSSRQFILLGAILFSAAVLFSIVTLPVEWDASARAKKLMVSSGIVSEREAGDAGKVLNAAFLTYVASAVSSLLTLLYYLIRAGVFRSDD